MTARKTPRSAPLDPIEVWRSLSDAQREAIASAVTIGEVVDTTDTPPLALFVVGSTALVIGAWTPDRRSRAALSEAFRPRGGRWFDPHKRDKDGKLPEAPKGWPVVVNRGAWFGPVNVMLDAAQALRSAGWTVHGATDLENAEEKLEAEREAAPTKLARLRIPGTSSRTDTSPDAPPMSAADVAAALAQLD